MPSHFLTCNDTLFLVNAKSCSFVKGKMMTRDHLEFNPTIGVLCNSVRLIRLFRLFSKNQYWGKNSNLQMVTHLSINLSAGCLTSEVFPFTLTALTFGSCLCCTLIEAFNLGILLSLCEKSLRMDEQWTLTFFTKG